VEAQKARILRIDCVMVVVRAEVLVEEASPRAAKPSAIGFASSDFWLQAPPMAGFGFPLQTETLLTGYVGIGYIGVIAVRWGLAI